MFGLWNVSKEELLPLLILMRQIGSYLQAPVSDCERDNDEDAVVPALYSNANCQFPSDLSPVNSPSFTWKTHTSVFHSLYLGA